MVRKAVVDPGRHPYGAEYTSKRAVTAPMSLLVLAKVHYGESVGAAIVAYFLGTNGKALLPYS